MILALVAQMAVVAHTRAEPASGVLGWLGPYPPLGVVYERINSLAEGHHDLAALKTIGHSVEGRPIYALHVGRNDGRSRPEALIIGNIHAGEVISSRVVLAVAQRLLEDEGTDPWIGSLLDRTDLWIVPVVNPDGYHRVISTNGRGGQIGTRRNANGVDLNRNFILAPGAKSRHPMSGSNRPGSNYYMGQKPLSEPETRALAELARSHNFYASFTCHSVAGKVLYPHCYTKEPARHRQEFIRVGEAFAARQPDWKYKVENSYGWYPTLGDSDDFFYMRHGALAFTVEHGKVGHNLKYALTHPKTFWIMNPHDADRWVNNDRDAVLAAVEEALAVTGGVPYDPADCHPEGQ